MLTNLLRSDACVLKFESTSSSKISWHQMGYLFLDWHIYLYTVISVCDLAVQKCLFMYLPSIIQDMGFATEYVSLMIIPPYTFAFFSSLLGGYVATCRKEHSLCLAFLLSCGILGFILMMTSAYLSKAALYISVCVAFFGTFSALPVLASWFTNNVSGHTKLTVAVGFGSAMTQIGGIIIPYVSTVS